VEIAMKRKIHAFAWKWTPDVQPLIQLLYSLSYIWEFSKNGPLYN
jgi:hypothetical protein